MGDAPDVPIRASDAERERTIVRLRDAGAAGRLTFEELADRVEAAASAVTQPELQRLTADLPAEPAAAPAPTGASAPIQATSVFGDVRRTGAWTVPAASKWQSFFGDVVLDLRGARVMTGEMHIDAGTVFGDVELLVPEGIDVEVRSRALIGSIKQQAGDAAPSGAPRVVLTGGTVFGDVRVRSRRLRERFWPAQA